MLTASHECPVKDYEVGSSSPHFVIPALPAGMTKWGLKGYTTTSLVVRCRIRAGVAGSGWRWFAIAHRPDER